MPQQKIDQLMSSLNESFGDEVTSPEQKALLAKVEQHIHNANEADFRDPSFRETIEIITEEIKDEHPAAAAITKEVLTLLANIGI